MATLADVLLPVAVGLAVLGLALGAVHRAVSSDLITTVGPILLTAAAAAFGVSFLIRAAARPPGAERSRYVGVGIVGLIGAVAIFVRDVWHFGPRGSWLWLILLLLAVVAGALLYWEDLRGQAS